jgi:ERCC4-type nuclease
MMEAEEPLNVQLDGGNDGAETGGSGGGGGTSLSIGDLGAGDGVGGQGTSRGTAGDATPPRHSSAASWLTAETAGHAETERGKVLPPDEYDRMEVRGILVAPTEPRLLKIGTVNMIPEAHGCDFLWVSRGIRFGVQRKEVGDLLNSVADGRLRKEVDQIRGSGTRGVLVVEGDVRWGADGKMIKKYGEVWNKDRWYGLMVGVQMEGVWVVHTRTMTDTLHFIRSFHAWSKKASHGSIGRRPNPTGLWGSSAENRDWAIHLLTAFPGVGAGTAEKIYEEFGCVPLKWGVTRKEMLNVKGVGKGMVAKMWEGVMRDE